MHHRDIEGGGLVGQAHIGRFGLGPGLHQPGNRRHGGIFAAGLGANDQVSGQVQGPSRDQGPRRSGKRRGFACQHGQVQIRTPLFYQPINRHPVTGRNH